MYFSIGSLLAIAIVIQMIYATVIRPRAEVLIAQSSVVKENGQTDRSNLRSPWVIIRDYEQEIAFILAIWSITLIVDQARQVARNRKLLDKVYIDVDENHVVLPEDARAYARPLERLSFEEQDMFLPRALMVGLNRFGSTRSVQDAAESVIDECEFEAARLDAHLSMVRFTAWAIPRYWVRGHGAGYRPRVAGGAGCASRRHLGRDAGARYHLQRDPDGAVAVDSGHVLLAPASAVAGQAGAGYPQLY
ncbi:MAG: hypothetical protein WDO68_28020 [Gammaproteobacteria bacterium]